jgi:hypothetical protein
MTTQTNPTETLPLRERARLAAERQAAETKAYAQRRREGYQQEARQAGPETFRAKLGVATEPEVWTPVHDEDPSDNYRTATATIEGLRFRAVRKYEGGGYGFTYTLYLLRICDNPNAEEIRSGEPHDEQAEVASLEGLHYLLNDGEWSISWYCPTCNWRRQEQREAAADAAPPPPRPTPGQVLVEALGALIDEAIAAHEMG